MLLRNVVQVRLGPVQVPATEHAARAHGDLGLLQVVAGILGGVARIEEGREPVDLIVLDHVELEREHDQHDGAGGQRDEVLGSGAGDDQDPHRDRGQHDRRADLDVDEDQSIVSAATISTRTTSASIGTGVRSSESIADKITISPIFANSDGLICSRLTPGMSMKLLVRALAPRDARDPQDQQQEERERRR